MKKIFFKSISLSILLTLTCMQLYSQVMNMPTTQTITRLKNSTTYIVLEGGMGSEFDMQIKKYANKYWTLTPFQIIDMNQYERLCKNPANSFLMLVQGQYNIQGKKLDVNLLTLVLGDKSGDINKMTDVLSIPLALLDEDGDSEEYGYKLGGILRAMQHTLNNLPAEKITSLNIKDYLQKDKNEIKNSTLLLTLEDLANDGYNVSQIKSFYTHPFAVVDENSIEKAIIEKEKACFCHIVGEDGKYCIKIIIHCADGRILYGNFHQVSNKTPIGLLKSDFQTIN